MIRAMFNNPVKVIIKPREAQVILEGVKLFEGKIEKLIRQAEFTQFDSGTFEEALAYVKEVKSRFEKILEENPFTPDHIIKEGYYYEPDGKGGTRKTKI